MTSSHGPHSAQAESTGRYGSADQRDIPRPATLTAAILAAAFSVIGGLAGAVITFADGKSMLLSSLGVSQPGSAGSLVSGAIDAAYQTLQSRAFMAIVMFAIVAGLAIGARGGRTGVRISLTVALFVAAAVCMLNISDSGTPGMIRGLDGISAVLAIITVVLTWLPPSQQFARQRRAIRRR
jgi:hypothetical protein